MEEIRRFLEAYRADILREADALSAQEMPELTEELFGLYERTGNRLEYENVYFLRRKFLLVFGLKAWLESGQREETVRKLEEVLIRICRETCWALPAHVDRSRPGWEITVDLFASETAQALAEIITVLGDALEEAVRARVREEVFRRVLDPFLDSEIPYAWWEHCDLNWCAVCNGSIGSAAMYLMNDDPGRQKRCLERVSDSMKYFLSGFSDDGACMEGLSYFTYGMTYFTGFAAQLLEFTNGERDLFADAKVERIAEFQQKCYFRSGKTLSFSDGSDNERFRMGLTCYLAMRCPGVRLPQTALAGGLLQDNCYRWMGAFRDLIWTELYLKQCENSGGRGEAGETGQITLPDAQWVICENSLGIGMAAKGGHNDEPHNHNDVGSFLYFCGEEQFLPDLGAGEYTKDYFHEGRYRIFCNNSFSHNVPVIGERGQQEGREHCCTRFQTDGSGIIRMEIQNAYPAGTVSRAERTLIFDPDSGRLTVEDEFDGACGSVQENLISYCVPEVNEDGFVLRGKESICTIRVHGTGLRTEAVDHVLHSGEHITVYRMVWEAGGITDGSGKTWFEIQAARQKGEF